MSIYESKEILIYFSIILFIVGTIFGSFCNCAAYRIARNESFGFDRSKCPDCHHVLAFYDLVPVISYLLTKGKCRYCGKKISLRYPLTEIIMGLLFVACLLKNDLSLLLVRNLILTCCLFVLSLVDLEIYEIPDGCIILALLSYLLWALVTANEIVKPLISGLIIGISILLLALLMDKVLKKESLGGGDIKLLFISGLYAGLTGSLFILIIACILGLLMALVLKKNMIPFGPAISIASWLIIIYGQQLINWYLSLI